MTKDELIAHLENIKGSVLHLLEGANGIPDPGSIPAGSPEAGTAVGTSSTPAPGEPPAAPVEQDIIKPPEGSIQDEPETAPEASAEAPETATEAPPVEQDIIKPPEGQPTPEEPQNAREAVEQARAQAATPEELQAAANLMRSAGYRVTPTNAG